MVQGIQVLRALGSLYDRIIAKRLYRWMHVEAEQSAFQKGKSAIIQIFTLCILIEIAKLKNVTLYIASVDLEKAFNKVGRYCLLSTLVARGIGYVMLEALKNIYLHTSCIIHYYCCFSTFLHLKLFLVLDKDLHPPYYFSFYLWMVCSHFYDSIVVMND